MKSKRTRALAIPTSVKKRVWERQHGRSIYSGEPITVSECCCHYIRRSHGGLGIEQNIIGLTHREHMIFDGNVIGSDKKERDAMRRVAKRHLNEFYKVWNEDDLIWRR